MPHIIGTAGHIDHGKTALIRALTGQETDRLKEEQARGISIDIGFAYLDLSTGERVGVVDVPGHERFIRNMLAGAHGIDLVLLVVAADDGVMPQTEEHLDILHLLGVSHGVVALTKCDLVDAARLRRAIEAQLAGYVRAPSTGFFRLPVDRAFIMQGHGIVVTGTALGGVIRPGETVRILPGNEEVRVRSVQVHGHEVAEAGHGQRVALNLAGIARTDIRRGHVVCDPRLDRTSDRADVWVEIRPGARRPVDSHEVVRVYVGTAEVMGKLVLLGGAAQLLPRQAGFAQLLLRQPMQVLRGDRFILRNQSAQRTLGGGIIVHPFARQHRRGDSSVLGHLQALRAAGSTAEVVQALLALEPDFAVSLDNLAQAANQPVDTLRQLLVRMPQLRPLPDASKTSSCTTAEKWKAFGAAVTAALQEFHRQHPLVPGMEMESLRTQIAPELPPKVYRALLDALTAERVLARDDSTVRMPSHRVALQRDEQELAGRAEAIIAGGGLTPPDVKEIEKALGVPRQRLELLLRQLDREQRVIRITPELYFSPSPLERARTLLRQHAETHGEISAATFRDLLGTSRKFSIALLDYFDRTGFTLRVGDVRKLRKTGS